MERDLASQIEALHIEAFVWAVACCQGDRHEAEDVLQTTYLKIADGRAKFGEQSAFKTWLFGVVRNTARERHRRRTTRHLLLVKWKPDPPPAPIAPDASVEAQQVASTLRAVLEGLSERQREVLELVFYHDLTIEEAAEVMDVSLGTARTHYHRGKQTMARRLAELEAELDQEGEDAER